MSAPPTIRLADIIRITGALAIVGLALVPSTGRTAQFAAFLLLLLSGLARLRDARLPLFAAWEVGAALIVLGDGLLPLTLGPLQEDPTEPARRFLALAACAVLLGYECTRVLIRSGNNNARTGPQPALTPAHDPIDLDSRARSRLLIILLVLTAYVVWQQLPAATELFRGGRLITAGLDSAGNGGGVFDALIQPLTRATGLALPALWVWWFGPRRRWYAALAASPILLLQLASGTRYYFLVAMAGIVLSFRWSRRDFLRALAICVIVLLPAGALMTSTRFEGLGTALDGGDEIIADWRILGGEGVLRTVSQIIDYTETEGYENGASILSVSVFFIPRAAWDKKPTLLGYWFPREYGLRGFGTAHSVSSGFSGDFLMDFGPVYGGMLVSVLGVGFALLDKTLDRIGRRRGVLELMSGCLYGLSFLSARSFSTALITGFGIFIVIVIIRWLTEVALTRYTLSQKAATNLYRRSYPL